MDDDENDNEDDDDDDVYDDVVLKVPIGTPMVPSSRIRFATTSRKYSWRQVARTERKVALQKRSAFTQKELSQFLKVRWLDCLVVWIGNGFPVDSRAALLPTPLLACMIDTR